MSRVPCCARPGGRRCTTPPRGSSASCPSTWSSGDARSRPRPAGAAPTWPARHRRDWAPPAWAVPRPPGGATSAQQRCLDARRARPRHPSLDPGDRVPTRRWPGHRRVTQGTGDKTVAAIDFGCGRTPAAAALCAGGEAERRSDQAAAWRGTRTSPRAPAISDRPVIWPISPGVWLAAALPTARMASPSATCRGGGLHRPRLGAGCGLLHIACSVISRLGWRGVGELLTRRRRPRSPAGVPARALDGRVEARVRPATRCRSA